MPETADDRAAAGWCSHRRLTWACARPRRGCRGWSAAASCPPRRGVCSSSACPPRCVLAFSVGPRSSPSSPRRCLSDGSPCATGAPSSRAASSACSCPRAPPLYVPAAASAFAILVVKQSFGGLGQELDEPRHGRRGLRASLVARADVHMGRGARGRVQAAGRAAPGGAARRPRRSAPRGLRRWQSFSSAGITFAISTPRDRVLDQLPRSRAVGTAFPHRGPSTCWSGMSAGGSAEFPCHCCCWARGFLLRRGIIRWHLPVSSRANVLSS